MFVKIRRLRWIVWGRLRLRNAIARQASRGDVKVILGASHTQFPGWIPSDLPHFNIVDRSHWKFLFRSHCASNLLAEHVFEHLTVDQVKQALRHCHDWMKPGGCLRIAVPDANHANPEYLKMTLPPADGHLSAWNYETFSNVLAECGFRAIPLEYYSHDKHLVKVPFDSVNGPVSRSLQQGYVHHEIRDYSSLVIDAIRT